MKKLFFLSLFVSCVSVSLAQSTFAWAKSFGGGGTDRSYSMTRDAAGNIYSTGWFNGTSDFDPGAGVFTLTAVGDYDVFVCKLDGQGNFVWAKSMGGTGLDAAHSITEAGGNIYITGQFDGTCDFDPGAGVFTISSVGGSTDGFVTKLDVSGNFIWAKNIGGATIEEGNAIGSDASGNLFITGSYNGTCDFDPSVAAYTLTSNGGFDAFVTKWDASGNFIWAGSMGSQLDELSIAISVDAAGAVYTTGYFNATADFDPGAAVATLTTMGGSDIYISKLDASGNFVWAKQMGGTQNDVGYAITVDASGNIYSTGSFGGTADFDPGAAVSNLIANGSNTSDVFVSKLDASGNFSWAKQMGGTANDVAHAISIDNAGGGNIYIAGYYSGSGDFDPGPAVYNLSSAGMEDVFVTKLNMSGVLIWSRSAGGPGEDKAFSIVSGTAGTYITGHFTGSGNFHTDGGTSNLTGTGSENFVLKLLPTLIDGMGETNSDEQISVYPNPATDKFTVLLENESGDASLTLYNIAGQIVDVLKLSKGRNEILTGHFPRGLYMYRISNANHIALNGKIVLD